MNKDLLFWERFRPKSKKTMVLLPRINEFFKNGIQTNVILHGHSGMGKTTLIRILLKNKNNKTINASLYNGIDLLRDDLKDFCESMPSPLIKTDDKMKYIYLEEFDNTTTAFKDGFKAFVEEYDSRVRFIITMNNITNTTEAIRSRFNIINFNPSNNNEKNYLIDGYNKYITAIINHLKLDVTDSNIKKLINKRFPDLRAIVQDVQELFILKDMPELSIISDNMNQEIFNFLLNGKNDMINNFDFVNDYMDRPDELLMVMGRPFFNYLMETNREILKIKGDTLINLAKNYNCTYDNNMVDPFVHLLSYITEIKKNISNG